MMTFARAKSRGFFVNAVVRCANSEAALATHSLGNYHWARTTTQFTLQLGDKLSTGWKIHLSKASTDWNSPGAVDSTSTPFLTAIVTGSSGRRCSMLVGTVPVCNSKYGSNRWLGLAYISVSGEHITQASAKVNDTYFASAKYNNPNKRQHVICQEVAHTFGLDHPSTDGSSLNMCMDYFSNTGASATSTASTTPDAHEFEQLNTIYVHLDSTNAVAALSPANAVQFHVTQDPLTWGYLLRQSADGRSAPCEQLHPDRTKTMTHVYLTEESASARLNCDHRVYR